MTWKRIIVQTTLITLLVYWYVSVYSLVKEVGEEVEFFDPYGILEIPKSANKAAIKRGYRKFSLKYHPDKHISKEEKEEAKAKFQKYRMAYETLTDDVKYNNWM